VIPSQERNGRPGKLNIATPSAFGLESSKESVKILPGLYLKPARRAIELFNNFPTSGPDDTPAHLDHPREARSVGVGGSPVK
jgi:hypothetical protein